MNADIFIIAFDLTRKDSFINVDKWLKSLEINEFNNVPIILVGLKSDIAIYAVSAEDIYNISKYGINV